jgi:hypothetical protein
MVLKAKAGNAMEVSENVLEAVHVEKVVPDDENQGA